MRLTIIWICLLLLSLPAKGQQGHATITAAYRFFEIKDGLPQRQVTGLMEDSHGFIWVSTKDGFSRWDGKSFQTWNSHTLGYSGIQAREILQIGNTEYIVLIAPSCRWLVGNQLEKILLPDSITDIGHTFLLNDSEVVFADCNINHIEYASFINDFRHFVYNFKKKRLTNTFTTNGTLHIQLFDGSFMAYQIGYPKNKVDIKLYLYSHYGILLDSMLTDYDILCTGRNSNVKKSNYLFLDKNDINKATVERLYMFDNKDGKLSRKEWKLRKPIPMHMGFGHVKIMQVNDTTFYYVDSSRYVHLVKGNSDFSYCKIPTTGFAILDHNNNFWLGTELGLYCFYFNPFQQYHFNFVPGISDDVWSMTKSNGKYQIAAYQKGIFEYDNSSNKWNKLHLSLGNKKLDKIRSEDLSMASFSATKLWDGNALLPLAKGFGIKAHNDIKMFLPIKGAETYAVTVDTVKKCAYISQYSYLYRLNSNYTLDTLCNTNTYGFHDILCSTLDKDGWPIFGGGGTKQSYLKYENGTFKYVLRKSSRPISMCTDHKKNIWIAASDSFFFSGKNGLIPINLPAKSLALSVAVFSEKWLLIGLSREFVLLDLEEYYKTGQVECYVYNYTNGFTGIECSQNSMLIDDDGTVWIPTASNVMRFNPNNLVKETATVSPIIDEIAFSGNDFNWQADTGIFDTVIVRRHNQRNIRFTFLAANVNGASEVNYRYRLLGYNETWSAPTTNNIAIFNKLPPGDYHFEVVSSIDGTHWGATAIGLPISLLPAFYETPLFIVFTVSIFIILFVGIVVIVMKYRYKKRNENQSANLQMLELKLQAIRSKAIPHFNGNIFNNIDYLITLARYDDASRYIAILSRLYDSILYDASKPSRSLKDEIQFVSYYLQLEKLRFSEKMEYKIIVAPSVDQQIHVPFMSVHTYVENGIKHGLMNKKEAGLLTIIAENGIDGIWISVTDNGIGRESVKKLNKPSTGAGLSILAQQIEIYNNRNSNKITEMVVDLNDEKGNPTGTSYQIYIPYTYNYQL